jgi:hypothetical protein
VRKETAEILMRAIHEASPEGKRVLASIIRYLNDDSWRAVPARRNFVPVVMPALVQAQIVPRPIAHPNSVPRPGEYRRRLPYLTKRCS